MKITVSKHIGFCNGVKNAVELALNNVGNNVYCLGNVIHNKRTVEHLAQKGLKTVENYRDVPAGSTVILRAHGVSKSIVDDFNARSIKIIDATCPVVKNIQKKAEEYYKNGYQVVLVGEKTHPEIIGINGWCDNSAIIVDATQKVDLNTFEKVVVMFQTTFPEENIEKSLKNLLTDNVKSLVILNTICYTTTERQRFVRDLSHYTDLFVILGDKTSSNTTKLFEIASQQCKTVVRAETLDDLKILDFSKFENISIISGTSTPNELIGEVLTQMEEKAVANVEVVSADTTESKAQIMFAQAVENIPERKGKIFHKGQKVKCSVAEVHDDGVIVSIPYWKQDGFVPNEELSLADWQQAKSALKVGDELECSVIDTDKKIVLSRKVIEERYKDDALVENIKNGEVFKCKMLKTGKDCLVGRLGSYTVIVHASQIKLGYVKKIEEYIGKELRLVSSADKVDDAKKLISASQKAILLSEKKAKEDEFWNNIEVDEIVEGKVLRFASFGAFVSVRGFDCLAHSSDLSWTRIDSPADVLKIGETYEFVVLSLNREKNRVSLGYKQLQPQPWEAAAIKFPVGSVVKGKVARIMNFGAFIELDKNIDGLLHISNVSWEWLEDINTALKVGDEIEVQVVEFDGDAKRITLSRRAVLPKPETATAQEETAEASEEPVAE